MVNPKLNEYRTKNERKILLRSWAYRLKPLFDSEYMAEVNTFLDEKYKIEQNMSPKRHFLYENLRACDFDSVKMVIISNQFFIPGFSNGIGFGVQKASKTTSYLLDCFRDCVNESFYSGDKTTLFDETLESFSDQGILFINSSVTCQLGFEHGIVWRRFNRELITLINKEKDDVVFVFLNNPQQYYIDLIDKTRNYVLVNDSSTFSPKNDILIKADDIICEKYTPYEHIVW